MSLGNIKSAPVEIDIVNPTQVTPRDSLKDNYIGYYDVQLAIGQSQSRLLFNRIEEGKRFRYVEGDGRELYHIKTFNPGSDRLRGMSKLDMAFYEVEQSLKSSIHNLSVLNKGARTSGALTSESVLADDIRPRIREELNREYAGAENAGKVMLLDGGKFQWHEMSSNLKDMDFRNLRRDVELGIYNIFNIPLPLVSPEHMTMDNYSEARIALYDNGVLPLINRIYEELSIFLLPRFKIDTNKFKLWYDIGEIPALEPRRNDEIQKKRDSGVLTINEIRDLLGYEAITGGDVLYQPMALVPVGTDTFLRKIPRAETSKANFVELMKKQLDIDGNRKYNDEQIEYAIMKVGLK
jgi:HK97 family phage portal protein